MFYLLNSNNTLGPNKICMGSKQKNRRRKIPHTGDKASLDRCGQQHQYQKNPASKAKFAELGRYEVPTPQMSVLASVDRIYPKMSDIVTVTDLMLATRQREGFKENLAQLQMNNAKNASFLTLDELKTQIQRHDNLVNRRAKKVLLNGINITKNVHIKFSRLL